MKAKYVSNVPLSNSRCSVCSHTLLSVSAFFFSLAMHLQLLKNTVYAFDDKQTSLNSSKNSHAHVGQSCAHENNKTPGKPLDLNS